MASAFLIKEQSLPILATVTIFVTMISLGLLVERKALAASLRRRTLLVALLLAVVVPVPILAVIGVELFDLHGPVAAGIILMAISPGAPVALRRALDAGSDRGFAPALHLSIVLQAVVTVPISVALMNAIFAVHFSVAPSEVAKQVFFAQFLPLGIGCGLRAWKPGLASWLEPRLTVISNSMLLLLLVVAIIVLGPLLLGIGWSPVLMGAGITSCGLALGVLAAGRQAWARPGAALAVAMRNPGLALLMASLNRAPPQTTAAVLGYALGLGAVVAAFVQFAKRSPSE